MAETIHIAHSPDSDDAFMFYALATGKLESDGLEFVHELKDIETLNQLALEGRYEVSAISIHAYAHLSDRYALLNSGASMGEGYGPMLVSTTPFPVEEISEHLIAIPGKWTSAYLALQLLSPNIRTQVIPFDEIMPAVQAGDVDAGLIIHEGQLTYRELGLHKIVDLGEWWKMETGLPLPLGGNVIRRDLGDQKTKRIAELIQASIQYGLEHREQALDYAMQFGRGLGEAQADRFVGMYVNERTLDYGDDGREAVRLFLKKGVEAGLVPDSVQIDFI